MTIHRLPVLVLVALQLSACPDPCIGQCPPWENCEAVYGHRWDEDNECFDRDVFVGCVEMVANPDVEYVAIDEEGECWRIPGRRTPRTWGLDTSVPYACPKDGPVESCDDR